MNGKSIFCNLRDKIFLKIYSKTRIFFIVGKNLIKNIVVVVLEILKKLEKKKPTQTRVIKI